MSLAPNRHHPIATAPPSASRSPGPPRRTSISAPPASSRDIPAPPAGDGDPATPPRVPPAPVTKVSPVKSGPSSSCRRGALLDRCQPSRNSFSVLGRALDFFQVDLYGLSILGSHYHLFFGAESALRMARFDCYLKIHPCIGCDRSSSARAKARDKMQFTGSNRRHNSDQDK